MWDYGLYRDIHAVYVEAVARCKSKKPRKAFCVGETGLEPATSAMSTQCSNQLSYPPEQAHIITRLLRFGNTTFTISLCTRPA
jgi:hypothetical protein